ncbi:MAG: hypothetical protein ACPF9I_06830 [Candidatus Thalassarchaeaceae archaeon]
MSPFDAAWEVAKADTGMWDEIYAPLLAQTTGMGELDSAKLFTDFVPTDFAVSLIHPGYNTSFLNPGKLGVEEYLDALRRNTGDHGHDVDSLAESIMEEGFNPERFRTERMDPSFEVNSKGLGAFEGRHRLLALDKLGAPYVPYAGRYADEVYANLQHEHPFPFGSDFDRDTKLVSSGGEASPWSIGGYMRRGRTQIPASYLYGREMVPGMGRLVPDVGDDSMLEENYRLIDKWLNDDGAGPSWKVIYDDEM